MKKLFLLIFILFSLHHLAQSQIYYVSSDGVEHGQSTISDYPFNPCQQPKFRVEFSVPPGYKICRVDWYDGASQPYATTTTNEITTIPITKSGQIIACNVFIDGISSNCGNPQGNPIGGLTTSMLPVLLTTPTTSATFNVGCTNQANFTSTIVNDPTHYYFPPAGSYSLLWALPSGWTNTSQALSTTVNPNALSGGNVSLRLTLNTCPYTSTSANYSVVRSRPTPTLSTSNSYSVCNGTTTQVYAVNSICGASSYTYTIQGNTGCVFTSNGLQTLTTTSNTANITFPQNASYSVTLSVVANFPDNTSSSSASSTINFGGVDYTKLAVVTSSFSVCPNQPIAFGARYNNNCINGSNSNITNINWYVSPAPSQIVYNSGMSGCAAGVNNSSVQIRFPSGTTQQYTIRISAQNACGTSPQSNPFTVTIKQSGCPYVPNFTVSPNPARNTITVTSSVADSENNSSFKDQIYRVRITDRYGVVRKEFENNSSLSSVRLSISNLHSGTYIVSVYNGNSWNSKTLVVQ